MSQLSVGRLQSGKNGLFFAFHSSRAEAALAPLLICSSFAKEASRAEHMLRVVSTQAAVLGRPVLRFDFSGTGDSDGRCEDIAPDQWLDDLVVADAELRRRTDSERTLWACLGVGANVALAATSAHLATPGGLVLWDPLERTLAEHLAVGEWAIPEWEGAPSVDPPAPSLFARTADQYEHRGYLISKAVEARLNAWALLHVDPAQAPPATWLSSRPAGNVPAAESLVASRRWRRTLCDPWEGTDANDYVASRVVARSIMSALNGAIEAEDPAHAAAMARQ